MARRKKGGASSLAKLTRSVARRKRKKPRSNPAPRANPPVMEDLWEYIVPGVASYGVVRLSGRIAYKLGRKKSPGWAKHLGAIVPALVAGGAWFAVHKVPAARKYHHGVIVGGAIAAIQSLAQTYIPQWSWILNDYHLDDVLPSAAQQPHAQMGPGQPTPQQHAQQSAPGSWDSTPPPPAAGYAPQPQANYAPAPQAPAQAPTIEAELDVAYPDPQSDTADAWGMGADDASLDALERELGLMN